MPFPTLQARYDLSQVIDKRDWLSWPVSQDLYVYLHLDHEGVPFYAGRGRTDRAWAVNGGHAWKWFVENRMGGEVPVYILDRALDDDESHELLEQVKSFHGLTLLIRANYARGMDYAAIERYWQQRANVQPFYKLVPQEKDEEIRLALAMEAQELQYQIDGHSTETGRFGEVLSAMGAVQDINGFFIKNIVEGLVMHGQLDDARYELDRFKKRAPRINVDKLENIIARGKFKRRATKPKD